MKISNLKINNKMLSLILALNLSFVPTIKSVKADTSIIVSGNTIIDKIDINNGFSFGFPKARGRAMKLSSDKIYEFVLEHSEEFNGLLSEHFNIKIDNFLYFGGKPAPTAIPLHLHHIKHFSTFDL